MAYAELKEPRVNRLLLLPSLFHQNDAADKNDDGVLVFDLIFRNVQAHQKWVML